MLTSQLQLIRDTRTLAGIITTRNTVYNLLNIDGAPDNARYKIVAWDDKNELLAIQHCGKMNAAQPGYITYVNYGIIDEVMTLDV